MPIFSPTPRPLYCRKRLTDRACAYLVASAMAALPAGVLQAAWVINTNTLDGQMQQEGTVAQTTNEQGYSLEIYRDERSNIRGRFSLNDVLAGIQDRNCPTYQVDNRSPDNVSINGAPCLMGNTWAEYILGQESDDRIVSPLLLSIMNGFNMKFRFRLENGDYRETSISLSGSKRSLTAVIGEQVVVRAR